MFPTFACLAIDKNKVLQNFFWKHHVIYVRIVHTLKALTSTQSKVFGLINAFVKFKICGSIQIV